MSAFQPLPRLPLTALAVAALLGAAAGVWPGAGTASAQVNAPTTQPSRLPTAPAQSRGTAEQASVDGVVEAVRQTVLAAQVPGAVVALQVKAGDRVKAGQLLLRLDARAAEQTAAAGAAQVRAARAAQDAATREFERQKQLFDKAYISQAALDRAEAQYKTAQAEAAAQLASAGAARTQSDFYLVRAPYDGVIAEVSVVLGDMAMPGKPLVTVYDPTALRVSAAVPQTLAAKLPADAKVQAELAGAPARITPVRTQLLPTVDPATHSQTLRLDLPAGTTAVPGQFARAWLPVAGSGDARVLVPAQAVVRRAELTAVYVAGADGKPLLRQVRLGRTEGTQVEVLSGLTAGEQVVLDPQAAARIR